VLGRVNSVLAPVHYTVVWLVGGPYRTRSVHKNSEKEVDVQTPINAIYKVKVNRSFISRFPFDLFYLVHADVRHLLSRLFPASLCFPIEDELKKLVDNLWTKSAVYVLDNHEEHKTCDGRIVLTQVVQPNQLDMYFLVVPILLEKRQVKEMGDDQLGVKVVSTHRSPKYITAPRHIKPTENKFSNIFSHGTVLFTPRGPMRPICLACPRHLLQLQGKCSLGGKECYTWLTLQGDQAAPREEADDEQLSGLGADVDHAPSE